MLPPRLQHHADDPDIVPLIIPPASYQTTYCLLTPMLPPRIDHSSDDWVFFQSQRNRLACQVRRRALESAVSARCPPRPRLWPRWFGGNHEAFSILLFATIVACLSSDVKCFSLRLG